MGAAADPGRRSLVLLGPPGAGKGTQATRLARELDLAHVSTGDLLRAAIASGSELGRQVRATVEAGHLVADEIVAALVGERLRSGAALLLDGFPRTVAQAILLSELVAEAGLPAPGVLELRIPERDIVQRLAARRTCSACGPRPAGETDACGACGGSLTARPDDAPDVVRERLQVYAAQTAPLTDHYRAAGLLVEIDGTGGIEEVADRVRQAARALLAPGQGGG